jgi:hypothetical protein
MYCYGVFSGQEIPDTFFSQKRLINSKIITGIIRHYNSFFYLFNRKMPCFKNGKFCATAACVRIVQCTMWLILEAKCFFKFSVLMHSAKHHSSKVAFRDFEEKFSWKHLDLRTRKCLDLSTVPGTTQNYYLAHFFVWQSL